jgi:hypothetical protein
MKVGAATNIPERMTNLRNQLVDPNNDHVAKVRLGMYLDFTGQYETMWHTLLSGKHLGPQPGWFMNGSPCHEVYKPASPEAMVRLLFGSKL